MLKKRMFSLFLAGVLCAGMLPTAAFPAGAADTEKIPIFEDPAYSFEERAADLVARMTPAQKGSQMVSTSSAIPAGALGGGALNVPATIGINKYGWWSEALHGYSRGGGSSNAVSYPQNLSAGSTWNPDLYYKEAGLISDEIRERTNKVAGSGANAGNAVDLTFYSPTVNMHRDPRWGRNEESYSEDPLLQSTMGTRFVLGMEGKNLDGTLLDPDGHLKLVTTVKHYTANNSERNRLDGGAETDLRALREYYTAPYRDVIQNAGVTSVMTAYSTLNGEPCSISSYLMETLLRQTWGFDGYITSDCDSTSTIARHHYVNPYTGKVLTPVEQFSQAMAHGEDLECSGGYNSGVGTYSSNVNAMVTAGAETDKGIFTENQVDISLQRLLAARMKTGEFDDAGTVQYTIDAAKRVEEQKTAAPDSAVYWQTKERLDTVKDIANEAVVMLKNTAPAGSSKNILPLQAGSSGSYKVAIVGAWQTNMYLGLYSAGQNNTSNQINIQKGITDALTAVNPDVTFTNIAKDTLTDQDKADIQAADAVIVVVGTSSNYSKEDGDRTTNALPNGLDAFISQVGKLNKNTVAVLETCGSMEVTKFENDVAAILWSSFGGLCKGTGFGSVISGAVNPSGKVTDTWYRTVNDLGASDIPSIYNYNLYATNGDSGRTYMYYTGDPSYPFGYGLSYTTFAYSNLKVMKDAAVAAGFDANDTVTVSFDVTNTGAVTGKEVAQLYVAQPDAEPELLRPIRRLEGFDKVELASNETKTVTLQVKISDLAFYNEAQDKYLVDTGKYQIQVGGSSEDLPLKSEFNVTGAMDAVPMVLTAKPNQTGDIAAGIEERLIFDTHKTVNPQLTLAMSDESLCGYIIKQQSSPIKKMGNNVPFPAGVTFTYHSNRPEVVKVDGGVITTEAPGVATITATAQVNGKDAVYDGKKVTAQFVVYVESTPYVDAITVNGAPIGGYQSKKFAYAVELPAGTSDIPAVAITGSNPDSEVVITQAAQVPGVATIVSTVQSTGQSVTYRIGFGVKPVSTDLTKGWAAAQSNGWTVNHQTDQAVFSDRGLTISTEKGAFASGSDKPKNLYLLSAMGSWVAQTQLAFSASPTVSNQQGGLIVYDDDQNYLRVVYERPTTGNNSAVRVYSVVNGVQTQAASVNLPNQQNLLFQIIKQEDSYTFMYSTGTSWTALGKSVTAYFANPRLGLWANHGDTDAQSIDVTFKELAIYKLDDLYPRLSAIGIDGSEYPAFDRETFAYNFEVKRGDTQVPIMTAEAADPDNHVEITQLTGPTGTAAITVSSGAASTTYTMNYNYGPVSDYFADGTKSSEWEVLRENTSAYRLIKGMGLELPTQQKDIYSTGAAWENCFVMPAMGSWEVVAKVFYPTKPKSNYQQAMLLAWQDEDNYIRINCQTGSLTVEPGMEVNGVFAGNGLNKSTAQAASDGSVTLYYKIAKTGLDYNVSFSQDGLDYRDLGTVQNINFANPKIGLFATENSSAAPFMTNFEYVTVTNLNGVEQKSYPEMLEDAVGNVLKYVVEDIPAAAASSIKFAPVPHGYTLDISSSDPAVVSNSGAVTRDKDTARTAKLTVTVSDGTYTKVSDPITVTVPKQDTPADDAEEEKPDENQGPSLYKEYEDYFRIGVFGDWSSKQALEQCNSSALANALKLNGQIGSNNTNSLSRKTYVAAVAEINENAGLTEEEKSRALQTANENILLDPSAMAGGIRTLDAIKAWNAEHPEDPKMVRAHVLAWHGGQQPMFFFCNGFTYNAQNPDWASPETMLARLDNYIRQMMEYYSAYSDIIYAWDVVNEAIDDYTGQIRNMEDYQSGQWGNIFRRKDLDDMPDERLEAESAWVRQAFESARKWSDEYECGWKLYYNDFQDSNKLYEPKMSQTIKMLEPIHATGNIDGYGLQGRLSYSYPTIDMLREQIELGLTVADEISISEGDIRSDFVPNPCYDPDEPTRRVTADDPEWPENSGSFKNISQGNGNTFDVHNSPVMRNPGWGLSFSGLAADPEIMKAQADFVADWMDLLIEYAKQGKVAAYQWDGNNDASTFNRTTGCTLWAADGSPKYSFYAFAGAPLRDKLRDAVAAAPAGSEAGNYTASSWDAYQSAKASAESAADMRIYTQEDIDAVEAASENLQSAIERLNGKAAASANFLSKGNSKGVEIANQKTSHIVPGLGMLLTDTAGSIWKDDNKPVDLVKTSAAGDWTATVKLNFNGGDKLRYYEYFTFVAMQDSDNFVGFQVGDGGIYLVRETAGSNVNLTSELQSTKIADVNYYRIEKADDNYTFYYSADGQTFTKAGEALDTGYRDVELAFDAFCTNQWSGKTMYVEYLHISSETAAESLWDYALRNAADFTIANMGSNITFPAGSQSVTLPTLKGYETSFLADDADIISAAGVVTAPAEAAAVSVRVRVSNAADTYTSDPVRVTVAGMAYKVESVTFQPDSLSKVDGDLHATVKITNTTAEQQTGLMVLALYDKDNYMVDYVTLGKRIEPGQSETFEAGFRVPFKAGEYEGYVVKVLVWDGTSLSDTNGNPLSAVTQMSE